MGLSYARSAGVHPGLGEGEATMTKLKLLLIAFILSALWVLYAVGRAIYFASMRGGP